MYPVVINKILCLKNNLIDISRQIKKQKQYQIQFYNCWDQKNEDMYWGQFVQSRNLLGGGKKRIAVFSVFGTRRAINIVKADVKIFYSAENLQRYPVYIGYCLDERNVDLAMGFDYVNDERYIRFPLWMDYMFPAESTDEDIRLICEQIRFPKIDNRSKFCCMVASNAADGLRDEMLDKVSSIQPVDSAGKYRHNDDSLFKEFGDDKHLYLRQYKFNICPENTSIKGYVSEKLFESMREGCVPIYWGSEGVIEPEVVNPNSLIYWNRDDGGKQAMKQIAELQSNPRLLHDFISQPRLLPTAEEFVLDTYHQIENKLREIIKNK